MRGALLGQRGFEARAFFFQPLQQIVHRRAMTLMAAKNEFGARHGRFGNGLDPLGLAIEFDGSGMRRLRGSTLPRRGNRHACASSVVPAALSVPSAVSIEAFNCAARPATVSLARAAACERSDATPRPTGAR